MLERFLAPLAAFVLALSGATLTACARTGPEDSGGGGAADAGKPPEPDAGPPIQTSDKLDVLLVVDNSDDLDLMHDVLANTVPYLMQRLAQPACVNGLGNVVAQTASPTAPCPVGVREFAPVTDVHVGVVTTSLGGHGADTCSPTSIQFDPEQDDAAHLVSRGLDGGTIPTWHNAGFLLWDPGQKASPPGDSDLGTFDAKLAAIVQGVGDKGCGFEAQLESFYRFLIDPAPYQSISLENGVAVAHGTDTALLQQRADFLRPDSAVAIVVVTDENDCSTRDGGSYYLPMLSIDPGTGQAFRMPRARAECAKDPNDPCCLSCAQKAPASCPPDPTCEASPTLSDAEDPLDLRCFDQKRRFGVDFLWPTSRYVDGLTQPTVADRSGNVGANPLFSAGRAPGLVVFAAVVGVPWQDIAAYPTSLALGFRPGEEIDWATVIGDPEHDVAPGDPLMVPSVTPRTGTNPATGEALAPPDAGYGANAINGHERTIATMDDLEPTCIYARPSPKDCTDSQANCACVGTDIDTNPECQAPDGSYGPLQYAHRALPGIRQLEVVKGLGPRGVAGSICAAVTADTASPIYGYKPTVDGVLRALRGRLR
ncbi:MAG TPA: hypothetical protein VHB21_14430 [Minicystis sp.]|nr:hypothetical protein [Minicystis sp.]